MTDLTKANRAWSAIHKPRIGLRRPWPPCQSDSSRRVRHVIQIPLRSWLPLPHRHHATQILRHSILHPSIQVQLENFVLFPGKRHDCRRPRHRMASLGRSIHHLPVHPGTQKLAPTSSRPLRVREPVASREHDCKRHHRRTHNALASTGTMESTHRPPAQTDFGRTLLLRLLVRESLPVAKTKLVCIADLQTTTIA